MKKKVGKLVLSRETLRTLNSLQHIVGAQTAGEECTGATLYNTCGACSGDCATGGPCSGVFCNSQLTCISCQPRC